MPLTDVKIRQAKAVDKALKLTDGHGLYLEVKAGGSKLWRYRYKIAGKENLFAIGAYPAVSLQDARKARDEARELVKLGRHPAHARRDAAAHQVGENANTFRAIADEWIEKKQGGWSPYYLRQVRRGMDADVYPLIGRRPMRSINAPQMLDLLNRITTRGATAVAINVRQWCSAVFRYAVATLRADHDPVAALRGSIIRPRVENASSMSREDIAALLSHLGDYGGRRTTTLALRFLLYTFVRTVEMRRAEWGEIGTDSALWIIPGPKMKKRRVHIVPLSRQALAVLAELRSITGAGVYLFPNSRRPDDLMSATTINRALEYLGAPFSGHDFRATAATHLYEMGFPGHLVEMQLAHAETDKTKAAYNHAKYLPERRVMMQTWGDWLDAIEAEK